MDKCRKLVLPCCHSLSASVPPPPGVCVSLHSESNYLLSLFTLKKAPAAVPVGRAWPASRAESGGAARQWEATGRRPEQSAVQLPEQRLQCRQPWGRFGVSFTVYCFKQLPSCVRHCFISWKWLKRLSESNFNPHLSTKSQPGIADSSSDTPVPYFTSVFTPLSLNMLSVTFWQ